MTIKNALAALGVSDLKAAEAWYTRLISRAPDSKPMDEVFEYRFPTGGWLQVFIGDERAGGGAATLVVGDLDAKLAELKAAGIYAGEPQRSDYADIAFVDDPDGNRITFAQAKSAANQAAG